MTLDLQFARSAFPALSRGTVFLDNAGGTQILGTVADRISDYLVATNVQLGATYAESVQAGARVDQATADVAEWIGARSPRELILGSSMTQLTRNLATSLGQTLERGDEIVVTRCDHEANISPWLSLQRSGVEIRWWPLHTQTGSLRFEDLAPLLSARTRLVCFTHCTNVLGTIHPVEKLTRKIHEHGALVFVDGVALAPHRKLDVSKWDVDFYAFSFYKTFGPHQSVLYGKESLLRELPGISLDFMGPEAVPDKLQPGKASYELSWSLGAIVEYLEELGKRTGQGSHRHEHLVRAFDAIAVHEADLTEQLLRYLVEVPRVRILGRRDASSQRRVSIVSFAVDQLDSSQVPATLDPHGIGVRFGDFYAPRLIEDLGLQQQNGVVRVSLAHYNTREEVDRLIEHLDPILRTNS